MRVPSDRAVPHARTADLSAEILEQAAAGDRGAAARVLETSYGQVRGMLQRLVGSGPDCEDCVQTALLRIVTRLGQLREPSAFSTWVGGICVNVARDHFRRRRVRDIVVPVADGDDALRVGEPARTPEEDLVARDELRRCLSLLEKLSPAQRVVFVLRVIHGYSVDEIAKTMRAAVSTTRLRLYYARKNFAKLLAEHLDRIDDPGEVEG